MSIKFEYATSMQPYEKVVKKEVAEQLLEALQDALHAYDKHGEHSEWDFARAAIAKALGETK